MSALVRAEWRRLFARRLTVAMMAATLSALALAGLAVGAHSHPHTAATLARAQAFADGQRAQNLELCLAEARAGRGPTEPECRQRAERFRPSVEEFEGYQFTFRRDMATLLVLLGGLLALFGFVVGASFVGAEWSAGGMMTVLVWCPHRVRVLAGKLAALLLGVTAFTVAASAAWVAAMWVVARIRGGAAGVTPGLVASLGLRDARVLALALACAAAGFALASIGRRTAAALGAAIGYVVTVEVVARIVLSAAHLNRPERFYLSSHALSWLQSAHGAGPLAAITIAGLAAAALVLRRRDVP